MTDDFEARRAGIEENLAQAERNRRVTEFSTKLLETAREQAVAMNASGPIRLSGEFEGETFNFYVELTTTNKEN